MATATLPTPTIPRGYAPSARAEVLTRRSYNRPIDEAGTTFETWPETIDRVIRHQRWLWERARGSRLRGDQAAELEELRGLMLTRKGLLAGRTLWLGGTDLVRERECASFNCAFAKVSSVHDIVDLFWLLLNGCVPPDTTILTESGPRRIDQVRVGDRVWSYNQNSDQVELKPVTATHDVHVPKEDNLRVVCRSGNFVTSIKHPVLVYRDDTWRYVAAGQLRLGDIVRKASFGQDFEDIRFDERAYFAGSFLGDGASNLTEIGSRRIRMVGDDEHVIARFASIIESLSGRDCSFKLSNRADYQVPCWNLEKTLAADNPLVVGWADLVGDLPSNKTYCLKVPDWIAASYDRNVLMSFLAGLIDTDGMVAGTKINIATSSRPLVDDLARLCPIFGIYPWVTAIDVDSYSSSGYRPTTTMYRVNFSVADFQPYASFLAHPEKRRKVEEFTLEAKSQHKTLVVPLSQVDRELQYLGLRTQSERKAQQYNYRYQIEKHGACRAAYYTSRGLSFDHLMIFDEVIDIEREVDIDPGFKDLTVKDNHSYLCGDGSYYVLHNCGTGFKPESGTLSGFSRRMEVEVIRSTRTAKGGREANVETFDPETGVWTISVGDSAEAWAKSAGKLVVGRYPARKVVLDFSEIRPAGGRLRGYGWLCSGDAPLARAFEAIAAIRNRRVGRLLSKVDLLDVLNWLGTVLSTRRAAEACLMDYGDPEWEAFATAKPPNFWEKNPQRRQSNNGLMFWEKPSAREIRRLFEMMVAHGGAEPSFNNAAEARRRAPWFSGYNPCFEILLMNRGFCNLVTLNVARYRDDDDGMHRAAWLLARANYRQTQVDLRDGVLQRAWHENNEFLRLCGVGLSGIAGRPDMDAYAFRQFRNSATAGAYSMADEMGTERPKNVTCVKPDGTAGKVMDCTEGAHKPLGRYIFNNVNFSRHDPLVPLLADAGYRVFDNPADPTGVLATLPTAFPDVPFESHLGTPVNLEPAVAQLERYRKLMGAWCDQNVSITVSYDPSEVPAMVKWFDRHWDSYVGVSFLFRNDPTKTAADLSFDYLPQEVVTKEDYDTYVAGLAPVDLGNAGDMDAFDSAEEPGCSSGGCPIR